MNQARIRLASYLIVGTGLLLGLHLRLGVALLGGTVVFVVIHDLAARLESRLAAPPARLLVAGAIAVAVVSLLVGLVLALLSFVRSGDSAVMLMLGKIAEALGQIADSLPGTLGDSVPRGAGEIRQRLMDYLRTHTNELGTLGKEGVKALVHLLFGLVIGALAAIATFRPAHEAGPLAVALKQRLACFAEAFRRVVYSQVKISAINTTFTAIFLLIVLPLFGVHLPSAKTLVALTFVAGLLPVVGNLISNSVIFLIGMTVSFWVGAAALAYLVVIHKLEYFINARIIGAKIDAQPWELLAAMLVMETLFGLVGLASAPIIYAFLKMELKEAELL